MCLQSRQCLKNAKTYESGYATNIASLGFVDANGNSYTRRTQSEHFTETHKNMSIAKVPIVFPMINESSWSRGHQTLVVALTSIRSSEKFLERSSRFVTSLNTPETIKADIMSMCDGDLYLGLIATGNGNGNNPYVKIREFAKSKGYAQVSILESTDDE